MTQAKLEMQTETVELPSERPLSWPGMQCVRCSKKADLEVRVGDIYEARCKGHREVKK